MPLTGKILEVNSALEESPEIINNEPYESGWIIKIKIEDIDQDLYVKLLEKIFQYP